MITEISGGLINSTLAGFLKEEKLNTHMWIPLVLSPEIQYQHLFDPYSGGVSPLLTPQVFDDQRQVFHRVLRTLKVE